MIFDFINLPFFSLGAPYDSLKLAPLWFCLVPSVRSSVMLFILVQPIPYVFTDSAISVFGSLGGLVAPCRFPSVVLQLRLHGMSARYIVFHDSCRFSCPLTVFREVV